MKLKAIIILLILSLYSNAQTKFEKGYYINNKGIKFEGYIKNSDWKNTPKKIEFKQTLEGVKEDINTSQITEFEIENFTKFQIYEVEIEKSSVKTGQITTNRTPLFKKENILLQVLVEGKASLYYYYESGIEKFFYSVDGKKIEQLVYLSYLADDSDFERLKPQGKDVIVNSTVLYDNSFRKQIFQNVKCSEDVKEITELQYNKSSLKNHFKKYNECSNSNFKSFDGNNKSDFRLKATFISNFNSLNLNRLNDSYYSIDFGNSISLGIGFEAEVVLPFNNNKWSVFAEPSFNFYKNSGILKKAIDPNEKQNVTVNYNYIQLPIGVRHYFYINDKSSIFINALYNSKIAIGKNGVEYEKTTGANPSIFKTLSNFAFGAGFNFDKYSIEARIFSSTQILEGATPQRYADYNNISLNFRYQLL